MANKRGNESSRGWFGDSEGHARAGRKGGLATAKKRKSSKEGGPSTE